MQYRLSNSNVYADLCNDNCGNPQVATGLAPGTYILRISQGELDRSNFCERELTVVITSVPATVDFGAGVSCLLYTSPSPRDATLSRMPSSA